MEYSRFILAVVVQRILTRRLYLVVFVALVAALAAGLYLRHRAIEAAEAAAKCETPALPPKPVAPPPKLPGFEIEAGCGVPAKPSPPAPK